MTLLSDLQAAGLPVISVSPNFEVTMGPMTEDQHRIYEAVLLHYWYPTDYPDIVDVVNYRLELKNAFDTIVATLHSYSVWNNASLPELRDQMKYVTGLMYKLMLVNKRQITTQKE